jgi:pyrroloquinoline quinone biosynthesis protein B
VKENDLLFLDGTFFRNGEIPGRDMSEIPHPFIEETMKLFDSLPENEKSKVFFIHLNHTNPALLRDSEAQQEISNKGFHVAKEGERIGL